MTKKITTTYILHGGYISGMTDTQNAKFRDVILDKLNGKKPRVAFIPFAGPRETWEGKFAKNADFMERLFDDNYEAKLVLPDAFRKAIAWANVVLIKGGDDVLLAHYLNQFKDLREMFSGKIIIGSSAGADYLSKIFWTGDWREIMDGRGLVDVAMIPHFGGEYGGDDPRGPINWEEAEQELRAATDLPVHLIREGEFEVFEVES